LLLGSLVFAQENWLEKKSEHFIVYFSRGHEDFAEEVADKAETFYDSIAEDLGYVRYSNFWKWDKRVKIYIFPDHRSYLKATGEQEWSHGIADYYKKTIISYAWGKGFLTTLLPHEMAHLIFRDFVGFKGEVPLWLDEGVAQWEEKELKHERKMFVRDLTRRNLLLSLNTLMHEDIRRINSDQIVTMQTVDAFTGETFTKQVSGEEFVQMYYVQAFSLVGFLIERYSADNFLVFCRQLRDGKTIADALKFAYPQNMRDLTSMQKQWQEYLLKY